MSDDFGTVNLGKRERAREIEVLRQHYRRHRDTLNGLAADAPTEHLAAEYRRAMQHIDGALLKLDEIEGRAPATPPLPAPGAQHPPRAHAEPLRAKTEPGMRPLAASPGAAAAHSDYDDSDRDSRSRLLLIAAAAVVALALIGWLIWRASSNREPVETIVEQTADTAPAIAEDDTIAPAEPPSPLSISPRTADYGPIRKGTRATRRFQIANASDQPISIQVARSNCRCLYYDYAEVVPPNGSDSITVTVDAAKAPAGALRESVRVSAKADQTIGATFDVIATIR